MQNLKLKMQNGTMVVLQIKKNEKIVKNGKKKNEKI